MISKNKLEKLVKQYEVRNFTDNDPSQFLRRFSDEKDIEIASFISALFSFGKREAFIEKLNLIFDKMEPSPYRFLLNFKGKEFKGFKYRFIKEEDLINLLFCLKELYSKGKTLKSLYEYGYNTSGEIKGMLQIVVDYFYSSSKNPESAGFKHLLPNPKKGSALKRFFITASAGARIITSDFLTLTDSFIGGV